MEQQPTLQFIITSTGFFLDTTIEITTPLQRAFQEHRYEALYEWGFQELESKLQASARFLYQVSESFLQALTTLPELELSRGESKVNVTDEIWNSIQPKIPFMLGSDYIDRNWLTLQFAQLHTVFVKEIQAFDGKVSTYLTQKNQKLKTPERIFFHLVENKESLLPFAFMATYATKMEDGKVHHMPLKYALVEFKKDRDKLLALLSCLNKAAEACPLLSQFIQSGELFYPLELSSEEAYEILKSIEAIEACGILCRIPNWWRKKYATVRINVKMGDKKPSLLGFDSLIAMQPILMVDGVELSKSDIKKLLQQSEGLAFLKGKWIEVDHAKLKKLLETLNENKGNISLLDAIRAPLHDPQASADPDNGVMISNGTWLTKLLQSLRDPSSLKPKTMPKYLKATLRPYQSLGYTWLHHMHDLGFGACLADDMGLGKTLQVLSFLAYLYEKAPQSKILLVVPASLLENWRKEAEKFTPKLHPHLLHGKPSALLASEVKEPTFFTITTYGMVSKIKGIEQVQWNCLILDEAQAIKNPLTAQTRAIKQLQANMRIAMTGTPIENELSNLWSLFDFLNKGLLGSFAEFKQFTNRLDSHPEGYDKLRTMVSPFILRRLKTDKTIITDLPDKVEMIDHIQLSKKQIVLYRNLVDAMEDKIIHSEGMEHRGIVLSTITKLKQICNHPDQFLGEEAYSMKDSGKFKMLQELCETIYEKRERVIVFTQYKEIITYLFDYLTEVFHQSGYVIHGSVPVNQRGKIVDLFNAEEYVPFIICSLKAAGTGLNLTAANHVIHFDRWWNPAVENQATDRAFRIGQKKNVIVHKFVSEGTIEEKIDAMINSKKALAESVIASGNENWITEMKGEDLMKLLRLDM